VQYDLAVLSPEKTIITYRLSSIGSRILAHILDLGVVAVVDYAIISFAAAGVGMFDETIAQVIVLFTITFSLFIYFILLEGLWNGQTLGKKAVGIRVRMSDGLPVTFAAALARNLMRPADMFPPFTYFMGLLAMFCTPKSQRFGDMIASTVVTHERRAMPYFTPAPHTAGIHPLEHHIGELRGMTIEEYNALRRFADRFPELPAPVQNKLVREVYQPIAQRRGIQPIANVHPLYLAEAAVMKYGREHGLL
jgi:uncharacterized RDD family membrane protein YckC